MTSAHIRRGKDRRIARLDHEVKVRHTELGRYCWSALATQHEDLLNLAGVVAFADRAMRRTPARTGWARDIRVTMPVTSPTYWSRPAVERALVDCLAYVTGDRWSFEFVKGRTPSQLAITLAKPTVHAAVPFSGGLDSFLLRADLESRKETPLLVTTRTSAAVRRLAHDVSRGPSASPPIIAGLPVAFTTGAHAEPTFRTRTFLFGCAAAVAAQLCGIRRVLIAENGQGSIGASLVPFGNEVPYRTTHPLFTRRLERFLSTIDLPVAFEHPYQWRTKGEVLRDVLARAPNSTWTTTKSCSRNLNRTKQVVGARACGICGNCMLRRMAVHAAGARDAVSYHWRLDTPTLTAVDAASRTTENDRAIAAHSVMSMDAFAKLDREASSLRRSKHAIATELGMSAREVAISHETLQSTHAAEWEAFLGHLPRQSWVRRYVMSSVTQP